MRPRKVLIVGVALAAVVGLAQATAPLAALSANDYGATHHSAVATVGKKRALREGLRFLWEEHIVWTRQFIVSSIAELPDAQTAAGRLLKNQEDIGNAVKPYYGAEAGDALTGLLKDHILIAADLLTAAKNGDQAGVEREYARWQDNGNDIADFLASANPKNWDQAEMRSMMNDHLELTLSEAVARLNEDWDEDVAAYDEIHRQALHMADMLSAGIIKQFPRKF